ncbi:helix-turn-helix transcriptional regulator [Streptomyces himalayensis]|uniref:helix-turn-helix transcriptional regulator n=1 Tax=Streptomyces himalayensis TaxID=2820085 RepID=UPI0028B0AB3E|nr:DNA-binding protein [Streptomyces himalayensis]
MPKSPDSEGVPRLMTISEIALEHGVSRQSVHSYRTTRGDFPKPVEGEGSTRPRFRADEVAAWFAANPPRPGKRTDLASPDQGAPMATTEHAQSDTLEADLSQAERVANVLAYQTGLAAQEVGLPRERADQLMRAVVRTVREVAAGWEEASDG